MANGLFGGGDGTPENPYLVEDADDLDMIRWDVKAHYLQTRNISLKKFENWEPIMAADTNKGYSFIGTYDGNHFRITGLNIQYYDKNNAGLFGVIGTTYGWDDDESIKIGVVKNVHVSGKCAGSVNVGLIVGRMDETSSITECSASGEVLTQQNGGLLAGYINYAEISRCNTNGVVKFSHTKGNNIFIGGLAGQCYEGFVTDCYSLATIAADVSNTDDYYILAGGLLGHYSGTVKNSYAANEFDLPMMIPDPGCYDAYFNNQGYSHEAATVKCTFDRSIGGLMAGNEYSDKNLISSFYDTSLHPYGTQNETGISHEEMKHKENFVGWDFENVWRIQEGKSYPYLLRPIVKGTCKSIEHFKLKEVE